MEKLEALPLACPDCSARMPETASFCPGCGRSMLRQPALQQPALPQVASRPSTPVSPEPAQEAVALPVINEKVGILRENIAGGLAYFTFIPAIVFLLRSPYKKNPFVRFHSIQSLLLWMAGLAAASALRLAGILLFFVPIVGPLFILLVSILTGLAAFVLWVVLVVKALQGRGYRLPLLGDFAADHADSH